MVKKLVHEHCQRLVANKIAAVDDALREAQRTANQETKSSAGDKYETGRAMMHLEQEKLAGQRATALQSKKVLDQIDPNRSGSRVGLGSLVQTDRGWFYVSVGLGQVAVGSEFCFAISPAAPLGNALWGRRAGEAATFNAQTVQVITVE